MGVLFTQLTVTIGFTVYFSDVEMVWRRLMRIAQWAVPSCRRPPSTLSRLLPAPRVRWLAPCVGVLARSPVYTPTLTQHALCWTGVLISWPRVGAGSGLERGNLVATDPAVGRTVGSDWNSCFDRSACARILYTNGILRRLGYGMGREGPRADAYGLGFDRAT
jgi:hypothetical protein